MNNLVSKSIFHLSSLTTISVGIFLSLISTGKVSAQEISISNLTDSVPNSTLELPQELENTDQKTVVNVIDFFNSDLISEESQINLDLKEDSPDQVADPAELLLVETQTIPDLNSEENLTENLSQESTNLEQNSNSISEEILNPNNAPLSSSFPVSACIKPLESNINVTQLSGEVNLSQILSDLETVYPSFNPLFFPTQPEEVSTENIKGITLTQAIELGQEHNKELQIARLNLERSQQVLEEALAGIYPTIGVEGAFTRNDSSSRELSIASSPFSDGDTISTTLTSGVNLNYNLYTGGRTQAEIRIAQEQIKLNELDFERVKEETRLNISTDYYRLQSADAEVGIQQQAVIDASQSLRDAELLEEAGLGTKFDVLRAKVNLADANQKLVRAIADQKVARRQLTQRLSLGEQVEVFAADKILIRNQWTCSLEESIIKSYRNRSELEQFLVQNTIEEQQVIVENSEIKPQVNFFANYDFLGVLDDDLSPADGFQLGVNLQWTLFDGGRAKARSEQNLIDQNIAQTNFADQRNKVRFEVEEAYYNLEANQQNIQTAAATVDLAKESLRLARLRFGAGVGTQTDVINAQTELTGAYGNLLRAITDYNLSLATLERAVSNLPNEYLFD